MTWHFVPAQRFAEIATAWDTLQRNTTDTPFLESAFLGPLLREFGSGRELVALHGSVQVPDAATIVRPAGRGMWETFQPSQLPLGPWVARPDALPGLVQSLVPALPGVALGVGLTQLDPRLTPRPPHDARLRTLDYIRTSFVDVSGPFAEYWESRGKNLRQNCKKQRNKLAAEGVAPVLQEIREPGAVAAAIADYGSLESAGWKAGTGTAIHPDNAQGRFYTAMLENFCRQGRGRLYRYCFGDKVVAMDLCIDNGPLVVVLKTAYDESYRQVSPSTLMRQEQFEAWWGEGRFRRIEFYGKTLEWHTRWTDQERQLYHLNAYRWALITRWRDRTRQQAGAAAGAGEDRATVEA